MSTKANQPNGIYLGYFTAELGNSMGIFLIKDQIVSGADMGGGTYDGTLEFIEDENVLQGEIEFRTKDGGVTITGAVSDLPVQFRTQVKLELPLESKSFHRLETMTGPINVRFEKVRDL